MGLSSPDKQREVLALSFEKTDHGYAYYQYRWSRGVPVSEDEREAYLALPALSSKRAWRQSIAGRQTSPPRAPKPVQRKLLRAMPLSMAIMGVSVGVLGLAAGLGQSNAVLAVIYLGGASIMLAFSAAIVTSRFAKP